MKKTSDAFNPFLFRDFRERSQIITASSGVSIWKVGRINALIEKLTPLSRIHQVLVGFLSHMFGSGQWTVFEGYAALKLMISKCHGSGAAMALHFLKDEVTVVLTAFHDNEKMRQQQLTFVPENLPDVCWMDTSKIRLTLAT